MKIELVPIQKLNPSTYNPRKADPLRLDIIELSLRKLGFLLPVYAHRSGEILSGHQRHYVASRMKVKHLPVCYVEQMNLEVRKAINIAFNRGTNDLKITDTPQNITDALRKVDIHKLAAALPDVEIDSKEFFPCLKAKPMPVDKFLKPNYGRWNNYARNLARMLHGYDIHMPVICTHDYKIVNGLGRAQLAAEKKLPTVDMIVISEEQAQLANAMLNYLSMDFDIHTRYRDLLRYNSFRRARRVRYELGRGFIFAVAPNSTAKVFDINNLNQRKRWIREHGRSIVDFGAGHLHEAKLLENAGVKVAAFEPYRLGESDTIDKPASLALAHKFLKIVADGKEFSSVFISSVLNSVPFREDREKIVCICAALCSDKSKLYATASSTAQVGIRNVKGKDVLSETNGKSLIFKLDYEPNITIGDFGDKPKVQKYHDAKEFYHLFKKYFIRVKAAAMHQNAHVICQYVNWKAVRRDLKEALEFEFNLPYPDGSTMDLSKEAITAFKTRLKIFNKGFQNEKNTEKLDV